MANSSVDLGAAASLASERRQSHRRSRFFLGMSLLLLALVLLGFGPSFYLRPFYEMPAETPIVFVHGALMTAWFLLLAAQASLAEARRIDIHRQLGIAAVVLAGVAVLLNVIVTLEFAARIANDEDLLDRPSIIWGNFAILSVFVACVALGVHYRRRPETHKRLMLIAGISMTPPALARYPLWWPELDGIVSDFGVVVLLVLALGIYDVITRSRIERTTLAGGLSLIALHFVSSRIAASEFGIAVVRALG